MTRKLFIAWMLLIAVTAAAASETWDTYYDQAECLYAEQEYLSAEQAALTAMSKVEVLKQDPQTADIDAEADCANLLALIYVRLGYFDKAAQYATRCNEIDLSSGDPNNIASSYNTLAGIYMADNQPDQAVQCTTNSTYQSDWSQGYERYLYHTDFTLTVTQDILNQFATDQTIGTGSVESFDGPSGGITIAYIEDVNRDGKPNFGNYNGSEELWLSNATSYDILSQALPAMRFT